MDATRIQEGEMVVLKRISKSLHPFEVEIGRMFSSEPLSSDPRNHCCPFYDVLQDPSDDDTLLIVMPLLRRYIDPEFMSVGEAVECFRQLFEVRIPALVNLWTMVLIPRCSRGFSSCTSIMSHIGASGVLLSSVPAN